MIWQDECYLLSKTNYNENSTIINIFSLKHGNISGIVYGGSSRKLKKILQIGNKLFVVHKSKHENKIGYFSVELIKPISPILFSNKKNISCYLSALSILRILLPEGQANKKIYNDLENFIGNLQDNKCIFFYILWEQLLLKELGFETKFNLDKFSINILGKNYKIPELFKNKDYNILSKLDIKNALILNRELLMEHFIIPNKLRIPLNRNILESYFN
ncbi:MAG: DNA repair protein RecO [Candidatus Pelagibacter sp. TMED64]|nr:DNA repair protein RecO [Candidatus Pelagibacter sp.]OUU67642.1 MAG: DNA repair protein RecO [Candidatus Pelagibacter sp. TMED64]